MDYTTKIYKYNENKEEWRWESPSNQVNCYYPSNTTSYSSNSYYDIKYINIDIIDWKKYIIDNKKKTRFELLDFED